jgi:hypothetical protein
VELLTVCHAHISGFDVNAKDQNGQTALLLATYYDRTDVVTALLAAGILITARLYYHQSYFVNYIYITSKGRYGSSYEYKHISEYWARNINFTSCTWAL